MRRLFFILFLFLSLPSVAQRRVDVTIESLFAFEPLSNYYSEKSLPSVATYISDWREYEAQTTLYIIDSLSWGYRHYCNKVDTTLLPRILEYLGAELLSAPDLLNTPRKLSHFPHSKDFNNYFESDIQAIRRYYSTPIFNFDTTLCYNPYADNDFEAFFHTFQRESTGAELSIFSPPHLNATLPQELFINNIAKLLYYDNDLVTVAMSGAEIKKMIEDGYARRFYRVRHEDDDLLRYQTPAYLWLSLCGTDYTVNLSKANGHRIENFKLIDSQIYSVAMNSFLARNRAITTHHGSYKELLLKWLQNTPNPLRLRTQTSIQPHRIAEIIRKREAKSIFGE